MDCSISRHLPSSSPVAYGTFYLVVVMPCLCLLPGTSQHHSVAQLCIASDEKRDMRVVGWERGGAIRGNPGEINRCESYTSVCELVCVCMFVDTGT